MSIGFVSVLACTPISLAVPSLKRLARKGDSCSLFLNSHACRSSRKPSRMREGATLRSMCGECLRQLGQWCRRHSRREPRGTASTEWVTASQSSGREGSSTICLAWAARVVAGELMARAGAMTSVMVLARAPTGQVTDLFGRKRAGNGGVGLVPRATSDKVANSRGPIHSRNNEHPRHG